MLKTPSAAEPNAQAVELDLAWLMFMRGWSRTQCPALCLHVCSLLCGVQ